MAPVSGYTDLPLGTSFTQLDGSTIVAGFHTQTGTQFRDARNNAFSVTPATTFFKAARYDVAKATDFFASRPRAEGVDIPRLPRDSGQLQIIASSELGFGGTLRAAAATGGKGAQVDISAANLQLVEGDTPALEGFVALDVAQLNSLGAESLLLGGLRDDVEGKTIVTTSASQVLVDKGVKLTGRDLLLVAKDDLSVASGATVEASGAVVQSPESLDFAGGGSLLRVSTGALLEVNRDNPNEELGTLALAEGAVVRASGSALLESSGDGDFASIVRSCAMRPSVFR